MAEKKRVVVVGARGVFGSLLVRELADSFDVVEAPRGQLDFRNAFAVACTAALHQKGRSFADETLRVCGSLLGDADPSVQKDVGWALREASKSDEKAVFDLLAKRKGTIRPRILREGSEKLTAKQRAALGL